MAFQFTQTGQELQYLADTAEKIATEYDATASWTTGDYCTHEGTIYRCTASTTGTFDASKWTAVILCDELEGLRARMTTAEGNIQTNANDIAALNQSLTNYVRIAEATVPCVMAAGATTATVTGYSVASSIPSGYKHIATYGLATSSNELYFYQVRGAAGVVVVQIKRPSGAVTSATTFNVSVGLICIRDV